MKQSRPPNLFEFLDCPAGRALIERAAEQTRVVLMARGPYASGLDEHVPAALMQAMVRVGAAHLWMESGHGLAEAATLVGWHPANLAKVLKRGRKGELGTLEPFVRDPLDAYMLAVAPDFKIRPGLRQKQILRDYADLLADQTRLDDTFAGRLLRQTPTHWPLSARRQSARELRVLHAVATGRPVRQRITLRELAAARLRGEVDERRIGYMDAFQVETSDGGTYWVVGMSVGNEGVCHVVSGPESGLAAQKLVLWFLRRFGRTFDVLVTDCHLAYREGSLTMLLLFMGIEHYSAAFVVDNDMERDISRIRQVMLSGRLLHREKALAHVLNGLSMPGKDAIKGLRLLGPAQLQLIEYDRFGTVETVDGYLRVGDFSLPAPAGVDGVFSCGVIYEHPEDVTQSQLARFDIFRAPVPVDKAARFPRLLDGARTFEVLGSWTLHVNGARGLRVTQQHFVPPVGGSDADDVGSTLRELRSIAAKAVPKTMAAQTTSADVPKRPGEREDPTQGGTGSGGREEGALETEPGDSVHQDGARDLGLPIAPLEAQVEKPDVQGLNSQILSGQNPADMVVVLPGQPFPAEVVELQGQEKCDSVQSKRPFQFRAPSLRRNPDLCEAVEAEGKHARPKPVAVRFVTEEDLRSDAARSVGWHLFDAGAVRLHDALPERLRFSFDQVMEQVDRARVANTARQTQRALEEALSDLRALPIRPRSAADRCRRDLAHTLESARAAAGRGEVLVARAYLNGVE